MGKYRKKPVVIEAFQIKQDLWSNPELWPDWFSDATKKPPGSDGKAFMGNAGVDAGMVEILTLEGSMTGSLGDWIIQGVNGEIYPCKPGIFAKTYDVIEETSE